MLKVHALLHSILTTGGARLLATGSGEPNNFYLYPVFLLKNSFDMHKYLITNPVIKTSYEFNGKLRT